MKKKTHKATAKRFKVTGTGKVTHKKQGNNNHYMTKKSNPRKLRVEKAGTLDSKTEAKKLKQLGNL